MSVILKEWDTSWSYSDLTMNMMTHQRDDFFQGTKAEVLAFLHKQKFPVGQIFYFTVQEWKASTEKIVHHIQQHFDSFDRVAVRSSALSEDLATESMAGAFLSVLNVPLRQSEKIHEAVSQVIASYEKCEDDENQVLICPMVDNVVMSGVIMTQVLDDGSPYRVINYDDVSGRTDTVTGGSHATKTVYVYNGVHFEDFDSPRLRKVLQLANSLEDIFPIPLDIEFAIDAEGNVHLFQVRPISTTENWQKKAIHAVSDRIVYVEDYISKLLRPRSGLLGKRTILGVMPDWNPAEMIGIVPAPLALSLYRNLITQHVWSVARAKMGYRKLPPIDLMVSISGRPYIDVRASFNSFLPDHLPDDIGERLVNAWLDRLDQHPELHDKVEFEVAHTVYDFDFHKAFTQRYPGLLNESELEIYKIALQQLTQKALMPNGTLDDALADIGHLKALQQYLPTQNGKDNFALACDIYTLLDDCQRYGTRPFSIAARHAFIAETLLRTALKRGAITADRLALFKRSVRTISSEMSADFRKVYRNEISTDDFLKLYGHLRPSSYDILSPCYAQRTDLFEGEAPAEREEAQFILTDAEQEAIESLLKEANLNVISAIDFMQYAAKAIAGREYAKFIFTRHLSAILEHAAAWGDSLGLMREQVSMLSIDHITSVLYSPLPKRPSKYFLKQIRKSVKEHDLACSFKLSHLIRSARDVYVVPQHRSAPNFITTKRVEAPVVVLRPDDSADHQLDGAIVCIEGADPGYDWIFTRKIVGLVTKYGGTNSHMAIRCSEYGLPAAIGCGVLLFEKIIQSSRCALDCSAKTLLPLSMQEAHPLINMETL